MIPPEPTASDEPQTTDGSKRNRNLRAAIASVILIGAFVWILARGGFPLLPPPGWTQTLKPGYFVAFCLAMVFNMVTRFARCHFLYAPLGNVPLRRTLTINAIGMAFITYLPLRIGEMVRPAMLKDKAGLSGWAVTGSVGAERILDGIVFSGMLLLGLAIATPQSPLPDHVGELPVPVWVIPQTARVAALFFTAAFAVMAAFYWLRATARRLTESVVGLVSKKLATRLADIVERLSEGLSFLTNVRYSAPYIVVTCISVGSQVWALQQLGLAVGMPELSFAQATVVLGVLALGFSAPNAPGFFGMVQLALYAGLATYIPPAHVAHEGAVFVFLFYSFYLINVTLLGAAAMLVEFFDRPRVASGASAA